MNNLKEIIKKIKQNKKYKSISNEIIKKEIKDYFKKNPDAQDNKTIIKEIRAILHKSYSSFQTKKKTKKYKYLEELKQNKNKETINKLLSLTLSTKERINDYEFIYKNIFKITKKPKTIIELGCGLNPLSFPYMNIDFLNYYAYDIDEEDRRFLNKYFKIMKNKINGKAEILDLRNNKKLSKIPFSDIIFLFKVIDIIDKENHKPSEKLIQILIKKTKFIVISFALKTITRKKMNFPKRKWFELMLNRLNLNYKIFKTDNEIFYIIKT